MESPFNLQIFVADCDDKGFIESLDDEGIEYSLERKYYYPTGADHPGIWIVVALFVGQSILSGTIHDGFKLLLSKLNQFVQERRNSSLDDGPMHQCLVLRAEDLEIEIAVDQGELTEGRVRAITAKVEAFRTLVERTEGNCKVRIPVEEGNGFYSFERHTPSTGQRFWSFDFAEGEFLVFDEQTPAIITDATP